MSSASLLFATHSQIDRVLESTRFGWVRYQLGFFGLCALGSWAPYTSRCQPSSTRIGQKTRSVNGLRGFGTVLLWSGPSPANGRWARPGSSCVLSRVSVVYHLGCVSSWLCDCVCAWLCIFSLTLVVYLFGTLLWNVIEYLVQTSCDLYVPIIIHDSASSLFIWLKICFHLNTFWISISIFQLEHTQPVPNTTVNGWPLLFVWFTPNISLYMLSAFLGIFCSLSFCEFAIDDTGHSYCLLANLRMPFLTPGFGLVTFLELDV